MAVEAQKPLSARSRNTKGVPKDASIDEGQGKNRNSGPGPSSYRNNTNGVTAFPARFCGSPWPFTRPPFSSFQKTCQDANCGTNRLTILNVQPSLTLHYLALPRGLLGFDKCPLPFAFSYADPQGLSTSFGGEAPSGASTRAEPARVSGAFRGSGRVLLRFCRFRDCRHAQLLFQYLSALWCRTAVAMGWEFRVIGVPTGSVESNHRETAVDKKMHKEREWRHGTENVGRYDPILPLMEEVYHVCLPGKGGKDQWGMVPKR